MHSYGEVGRTLVRTLVVIRMRCVKLIVIALCALLAIIGVTDYGGFVGIAVGFMERWRVLSWIGFARLCY